MGQGVAQGDLHSGAAVCIFEPYTYAHPTGSTPPPSPNKKPGGLVRLLQVDPETCLVDVTVHGFPAGRYDVEIRECGDLSRGCESTGELIRRLGEIKVGEDGWGDLIVEEGEVKVWEVVGRGITVSLEGKKGVMAGVVARSAGVFENAKRVCSCSGKTLWEEERVVRAGL